MSSTTCSLPAFHHSLVIYRLFIFVHLKGVVASLLSMYAPALMEFIPLSVSGMDVQRSSHCTRWRLRGGDYGRMQSVVARESLLKTEDKFEKKVFARSG